MLLWTRNVKVVNFRTKFSFFTLLYTSVSDKSNCFIQICKEKNVCPKHDKLIFTRYSVASVPNHVYIQKVNMGMHMAP